MNRFPKRYILFSIFIVVGCATTSVVDIPTTIKTVPDQQEKTPEDIVNEWLSFAQEERWEEMVKIAQLTWVSNKGLKAAEEISWNYDFFDIQGWRILSTSKKSDTFYTVTAEVDTQLGKKTMNASVIREIAPYQPSVNGKWGINPISAMLR